MVVDFSIITPIGMLLAMVVGKVLKSKPNFQNKMIPWVTLLISVLTQIFEVQPANAGFSVGALFGSSFGHFALQTLGQWLITTGTHSTSKNLLS